jgi:hypothetical protein
VTRHGKASESLVARHGVAASQSPVEYEARPRGKIPPRAKAMLRGNARPRSKASARERQGHVARQDFSASHGLVASPCGKGRQGTAKQRLMASMVSWECKARQDLVAKNDKASWQRKESWQLRARPRS